MSVPSSSASFTVRTEVSLTHRGTPTVESWSSRETVVVGHRGGGGGGGGFGVPNLASTYYSVFIVTQFFFLSQRELTLQRDAFLGGGGRERS